MDVYQKDSANKAALSSRWSTTGGRKSYGLTQHVKLTGNDADRRSIRLKYRSLPHINRAMGTYGAFYARIRFSLPALPGITEISRIPDSDVLTERRISASST